MRKALDRGRINLAVYVYALRLLRKYNRTSEILRGDTRNADAGRFYSQYLVYALVGEQPAELLADLVVKLNIHLMIEKAVDLEYVPLFYYTVLVYAIFQ